VPVAIVERSKIRAQYKIITAIDFDGSNNYALDKFKNLDRSVFQSDGFDVLITEGKNLGETINEMKALTEFIRTRINPTLEIRFVLGALHRSKEAIDLILQAAKSVPVAYIRTDHHLVSPKCNDDVQNSIISSIRKVIPYPIKLSCNITLDTCQKFNVNRFDVTTTQIKEIIKRSVEQTKSDDSIKQDIKTFRTMGYSETESIRRAMASREDKNDGTLPFPED
jgi:hypothetical protein